MGYMNWFSLSARMMLVLIIISVIGPAMAALTPLIHMTNHCYKNVYVNDSLVLDLTENLKADRVMVGHLSCAVTLHAPPGARVYLHVLQLAISDHAQMPDRLHIYDVSSQGKVTRRLTPSTGLYGVLERPFLIYNTAGIIVPDFRSAGPRMRLDYQGKPTIIYRGFRVLATVFYNPEANGKCRQGTLHCVYAGTCVPLSTRCDGFPNCGLDDNSDEKRCRREYVVSNVLDEYSTRTAVIAAVTGIVVFLGVAALVFFVVIRYTRKKYGRSADQSVRYTSRGGGACEVKDETDLTRLYAPPSYEDVMTAPQGGDPSAPTGRGRGYPRHHRHSGPPPAYSAVAALVHQDEDGLSSEDDVSHKRPATLWSSSQAPPPPPHHHHHHHYHNHPPPPHSQRHGHPNPGGRAACAASDWEEDVRMHGTWPSDTDEEEEVRARRKKKGGKGKGKVKASCKLESGGGGGGDTPSSKGCGDESGPDGGDLTRCARSEVPTAAAMSSSSPARQRVGEEGLVGDASSSSPSPCPDCQQSSCSPGHQCSCPSAGSSDVPSDVPSGAGSGVDVVSETESQLASSKRNSRTESNSPDTSCASSHSDSPAKPPLGEEAKHPVTIGSKEESDPKPHHLHSSSLSSSVHPLSPSVIPLDKLSPKTSSEDSLHQKDGDQNAACEEGFVDLNPANSSSRRDCVLHS